MLMYIGCLGIISLFLFVISLILYLIIVMISYGICNLKKKQVWPMTWIVKSIKKFGNNYYLVGVLPLFLILYIVLHLSGYFDILMNILVNRM